MSVSTKSNLPQHEPLKWNLRKAAQEFGTTPDTLKKTLNRVSQEPDVNGLYTTGQLVQALFGQLHVEKIRYQRACAEKVELENSVAKAELLDKRELTTSFAALADAMTCIITTSGLNREEQQSLQRELASIPVIIADTARRQNKLHRAKNGQTEVDKDRG
jgi:hypothetical protein